MRSLNRGPSPVVCVKMPDDLLRDVDRERHLHGLSRSALIRQILREALDRARQEDAK